MIMRVSQSIDCERYRQQCALIGRHDYIERCSDCLFAEQSIGATATLYMYCYVDI